MDPEMTKACLEKFQREIEQSPARAFLSSVDPAVDAKPPPGFLVYGDTYWPKHTLVAMERRIKQGLVLLDHAREFPTGREITGLGCSISTKDFKRRYRFAGIDRAGPQSDDEKDAITLTQYAIKVENIRGMTCSSVFIDDPCGPPELEIVFVGYDPQKG